MAVSTRVNFEKWHALKDVSDIVNEYGEDVTIIIRGEGDVTRDKYNSITKQSTSVDLTYNLKAKPVDHNPNRQQMEKAGIREDCQSIVWFAMKDLLDRKLDFDKIENEKVTVVLDGNDYGIREKNKAVDFADEHLYFTMGLFKKP